MAPIGQRLARFTLVAGAELEDAEPPVATEWFPGSTSDSKGYDLIHI